MVNIETFPYKNSLLTSKNYKPKYKKFDVKFGEKAFDFHIKSDENLLLTKTRANNNILTNDYAKIHVKTADFLSHRHHKLHKRDFSNKIEKPQEKEDVHTNEYNFTPTKIYMHTSISPRINKSLQKEYYRKDIFGSNNKQIFLTQTKVPVHNENFGLSKVIDIKNLQTNIKKNNVESEKISNPNFDKKTINK